MQQADSQTSAPRPARARPRGSLRRRVLLVLLLLTLVPGYVGIVLMWFAVQGTFESRTRQEAFGNARIQAIELDTAINTLLANFRAVSGDESLAIEIHQILLERDRGLIDDVGWFSQPAFRVPEGFEDVPFYVVARGTIIAHIEAEGLRFRFERPTPLDGTGVLTELLRAQPSGTFLAEPQVQDWTNPMLIFGASLPAAAPSREPLVLLAARPMTQTFRDVDRRYRAAGASLVVISRRTGVLFPSQAGDDEFAIQVNRLRDSLFDPQGGEELLQLSLQTRDLGIAWSRAGSVSQLGSLNPRFPLEWTVVQTVDMAEMLATVTPLFWAAILIALGLTVVALLLALVASARLVRPILELTRGMQQFARGDLGYRVNVSTGDELESLASSANEMADSLRLSYENLAQRMLELDEKARQLELIHSISYSINRTLDMGKLFARLTNEIREQIPATDRIALISLTPERDGLSLDFVYPAERELFPRGTILPLEGSVTGRALKDQVVTIRRVRPEGRYIEDTTLAGLGLKVLCVVPLVATNGALGTLNLASSDEECFTTPRIKLLERVADSLALAVEHSRLYARVARFAGELEEMVEARTAELKAAQLRLVQTEKFAATGSIAAHIGHEVNNPLSIIKNYLRILSGRVSSDHIEGADLETARKGLAIIEEEIDRIARIITQLRQVSKPEKAEAREVDVAEEIRKVTALFEGTLRKRRIDLETDVDETIGSKVLVGDYLRQILINLLRNSMDAMEDSGGGVIIVRSRNNKPTPGWYVVEVSDSGCGIPADVVAKIFDPFFTTKGEGKGTGLGLSVSFGLAQTMGGSMEVDSVEGKGTTMRLILPAVATQSAPAGDGSPQPPTPDEPTPVRRRGQKIIIG